MCNASKSNLPVSISHPCSQAKMSTASDSNLPILTKFSLEERGEQVEVQPVWVLVHQEHPGGPARYAAPCSCYHLLLPLVGTSCPIGVLTMPSDVATIWPLLLLPVAHGVATRHCYYTLPPHCHHIPPLVLLPVLLAKWRSRLLISGIFCFSNGAAVSSQG